MLRVALSSKMLHVITHLVNIISPTIAMLVVQCLSKVYQLQLFLNHKLKIETFKNLFLILLKIWNIAKSILNKFVKCQRKIQLETLRYLWIPLTCMNRCKHTKMLRHCHWTSLIHSASRNRMRVNLGLRNLIIAKLRKVMVKLQTHNTQWALNCRHHFLLTCMIISKATSMLHLSDGLC